MPKQKKGQKRIITLYIVIRFLITLVMVRNIMIKDYNNVFMCVLSLLLLFIPTIIDKRFNIKLPSVLESIIVLFIFASQILGEIQEFYLRVPHWDTMLHTLNGFIMGAIGFAMIDILNQSPRLHFNMSPVFVAFVGFCFSMTIGVLWEFFEYFMDINTLSDMQKDTLVPLISSVSLNPEIKNTSLAIKDITKTVIYGTINNVETAYQIDGGYLDIGIIDTMKDLIVNCIGALSFSVAGTFYVMGRGKFAKNFIPVMKTQEEIEHSEATEDENTD